MKQTSIKKNIPKLQKVSVSKLKFSYLIYFTAILASATDFESHLSLFLNMVSHDQLCDAQELLFLALLASNFKLHI